MQPEFCLKTTTVFISFVFFPTKIFGANNGTGFTIEVSKKAPFCQTAFFQKQKTGGQ